MTADEKLNIGQALLDIADNVEKLLPHIRTIGDALLSSPAKEEPATKQPSPASKDNTYTLEDVRAVLAEKSRECHTTEVRELLNKYGANRLSAVDPSNYAALMADAEVICNG